jgi:excisionase family DNA binding protein
MRHKGTSRILGIEVACVSSCGTWSATSFAIFQQVAHALKVIPDTVRSWIQSGALRASRPGNGTRPGRKYRVRRADLDAFVAVSQSPLGSAEGVTATEVPRISAGMSHRPG